MNIQSHRVPPFGVGMWESCRASYEQQTPTAARIDELQKEVAALKRDVDCLSAVRTPDRLNRFGKAIEGVLETPQYLDPEPSTYLDYLDPDQP